MNKTLRAALALAISGLAMHGAQAATAQVVVNGSTVSVSPSALVLQSGDKAADYTLLTKGHVIVSISAPNMACSVAGDGMSASCTRDDSVTGQRKATLVVKPAGGSNLPSPNIFIQAD